MIKRYKNYIAEKELLQRQNGKVGGAARGIRTLDILNHNQAL